MAERKTVVVAMSGGVDSSVAAALLVERGYTVIGVMMRLWSEPLSAGEQGSQGAGETLLSLSSPPAPEIEFAANRDCSPESVADARAVCAQLGIPFYLLNLAAEFKTRVVDDFIAEYARGYTPNPCVQCNRWIKFGALLDKVRALGADYLATGHYVRGRARGGQFELLRGADAQKDQSYALYRLTQAQLASTLFPLGEFFKAETRARARALGLPVSAKRESQDLCFAADGDYRNFLRRNVPGALTPGDIVDARGNVLGRHAGLAFYTVGQRKGMGFAVGEPLFVLALDAARNRVVVGRAEELGRCDLIAEKVNWIAGSAPAMPRRVTAKIRYQAAEVGATLTLGNRGAGAESVRVLFDEPLRDITPGQSVVFYDGVVCLGGGVIQ